MRTSFISLMTAVALLLGGAAAAQPQDFQPVMEFLPRYCGMDLTNGLYLCSSRKTLFAYDMNSGARAWSYTADPSVRYLSAVQTKGGMIVYPYNKETVNTVDVIVLDIHTGQVKWRYTHRCPHSFEGIIGWPGSTCYFLWLNRATEEESRRDYYGVFCSQDGTRQIPCPVNGRPVQWLEEGRTLLLADGNRVLQWDIDSGEVKDLSVQDVGRFQGCLHNGNLFFFRDSTYLTHAGTYEIVVGATGQLVRRVPTPEHARSGTKPVMDGKALLFYDKECNTLWLVDADTDELRVMLYAPGHSFWPSSFRQDAAGKPWILSLDEEEHTYLWPVEPNAKPSKIFNIDSWLRGNTTVGIQPPYVITGSWDKNITTYRAYDFEQRSLVSQWILSGNYHQRQLHICNAMKRFAASNFKGTEAYFEIFEANVPEPILKVSALMLDFSPNGEYVVAKSPDGTLILLHVSTGHTLAELPKESQYSDGYAVFAPDSSRAALYNGYNNCKVVRLSGETVTETPMDLPFGTWFSSQCFSPDGTRLLSTTTKRAWLHDSDTGRLLHTFVEPQRFRSRYVHVPEVMGIKMPFVNYLGDLAGNFTNLANSEPMLQGTFIGDGARVLTVAERQMIRVWDARTGRSLHTIFPSLSNARNENGTMQNNIILSRNGAFALCFNFNDGDATLWGVAAGNEIHHFANWHEMYGDIFVSDDGRRVYLPWGCSLYCWSSTPN